MTAGPVNLSCPAGLYWSVDVRSKGPDRAQPNRAVDYEQVFRDAAPGLWRAIYAFAAGRRAVADDAGADNPTKAMTFWGSSRPNANGPRASGGVYHIS